MRQADLGKMIGTSGDIIGKYERNENMPSIEIATKMAKALGISLDYLVGKTEVELDDKILDRVLEIQKLPTDDRSHLLYLVDGLLQNVKSRLAFKS